MSDCVRRIRPHLNRIVKRAPSARRAHRRGSASTVSDLDRSLAFYTEVLGFAELQRSGSRVAPGPRWRDRRSCSRLERAHRCAAAGRDGSSGLYHVAILVPDRAALGRSLRRLCGAAHGRLTGASDHLVSEALYLDDPDGAGHRDLSRSAAATTWTRTRGRSGDGHRAARPRTAWRANRARSQPWSGLHTGTRIGHVHLHVPDLERRRTRSTATAIGFAPTLRRYPGALFVAAGVVSPSRRAERVGRPWRAAARAGHRGLGRVHHRSQRLCRRGGSLDPTTTRVTVTCRPTG